MASQGAWWDGWEERTLPDESNVNALREMWGRTGGRLNKWKAQDGWKPPPPTMNPVSIPADESERDTLARLYGADLAQKPSFGVLWREGRVAKLELPRNGLEGPVPTQLEALDRCRVICLFGNRLNGRLDGARLPASLVHLDLSGNRVDGPIPPEIARLRRLRRLHLQNNRLSGPLPDVFDALEDLEEFTAQRNRLSGPLPASVGGCGTLRKLFLHENPKLKGPVPEAWAQCGKLAQVLLAETSVAADSTPPDLAARCDVQISAPVPKDDRPPRDTVVEPAEAAS